MVKMTARYEGGLSCEATHGPSETKIMTDAPIDIGGGGRAFSPTDLVGAALLTCILTTVASVAEKYDLALKGMHGSVEKIMTDTSPRRIAKVVVEVYIPVTEDHALRDKLERAVHYCPVHHALHPDIVKDVRVLWG